MVYVPNYDTNNCAIVKDNTTIRVYDNRPQLTDENYTYTDYFYNSHYYFVTGNETFTSTELLPTCISSDDITTDFYYRSDLAQILLIFLILFIFCILIPLKLFTRFFRRFR